jgi:hypothetical protein
MQVATQKQLNNLKTDDITVWSKAYNAAIAINDILDNFDELTDDQKMQVADRLRALADKVDGRETSNGHENTWTYHG